MADKESGFGEQFGAVFDAKQKEAQKKYSNNGHDDNFELKSLSWDEISVERFLKRDPPEPKYIFDKLIMQGLVYGFFATGGTGKSFLLKQLAVSLATTKNFGPFLPTKIFKILYVGCEDPEWELHRRINLIAKNWGLLEAKDLVKNLGVYCGIGKIGPLLMLKDNNAITTHYYDWLRQSIENIKDLEILILDPMSRLYGLNENDNAHGTAWIHALEKLAQDYNLSVWFAHHEPKSASQTKNLRDSQGRGAGAIRDGCRGAISIREMTDTDAQKYEVNPRDYIELDISKANYTAKLPNSIFFKRCDGGLLETVNLQRDRLKQIAETLINELCALSECAQISRSDLQQNRGDGKEIVKKLSENCNFKRTRDMGAVIDYALEQGMIYETSVPSSRGAQKRIIKVYK